VAAFFRPEFFNRIDAVVNFSPLDEKTIMQIATAELQKITDREGIRLRGLNLQWTHEVLHLICSNGYDARYGARPLQRAIENLVVTPLAKFLIARPDLRNASVLLTLDSSQSIAFAVAG
jgi:ATP-dependent Clp protease ATP-binding subunit ClpA